MKSNLQAIFGLIDLKLELLREKQTLSMLKESHDRIKAISLMKQKLEKTGFLGKIDFGSYLQNLSQRLLLVFGADKEKIKLEINIAGLLLEVKTAIICGLIVTELLSNALKYAFPGNRPGTIFLEAYKRTPEKLILKIGDDGVGLPQDIDLRSPRSLGLQVVRELVRQLQGTIRVNRKKGTHYHLVLTSP